MKLGPIEIFPKEEPELNGTWGMFWFLPFTGAHLFYMGYKKQGLIGIFLLGAWILTPFILSLNTLEAAPLFRKWIYAVFILIVVWLYDCLTLKSLFVAKWGRKKGDWM